MSIIEVTSKGAELEASVADEIVVRLTENATTGYEWTVAEAGSALRVEANEFTVEPAGAPGAAGQRVVRFRAVQPGDATVRLILARPWEQGQPPQEEFDFLVRVS